MSVKSTVLEILESSRHADVSGEYIAAMMGVSRNSVWKAIKSLRQDGYNICSSTNKGYRLSPDCDIISTEGISVNTQMKIPVYAYKTTDSTNMRAKCFLAEKTCDRALFVAEEQTLGRGRMGKDFYSPYGTGIYMSYVFSPNTEITNAVTITAAAAVAVVCALEKLCGISPMIKWVNDIYLDGKKLCGILTEAVTNYETGIVSHIIIGIGINFSTVRFPENIRNTACSLPSAVAVTRNELIGAISDNLYSISNDLEDRSYFEIYRDRMLVIGKDIVYYQNGKPHYAYAVDVDSSGGLIVSDSDGNVKTLRSGEITLRTR